MIVHECDNANCDFITFHSYLRQGDNTLFILRSLSFDETIQVELHSDFNGV